MGLGLGVHDRICIQPERGRRVGVGRWARAFSRRGGRMACAAEVCQIARGGLHESYKRGVEARCESVRGGLREPPGPPRITTGTGAGRRGGHPAAPFHSSVWSRCSGFASAVATPIPWFCRNVAIPPIRMTRFVSQKPDRKSVV